MKAIVSIAILFLAACASNLDESKAENQQYHIESIVLDSGSGKTPPRYDDLTATEQKLWKNLVGKWYGKVIEQDGTIREWLSTFTTSGAYSLDLIKTKNDNIAKTSTYGTWSVEGDVHNLTGTAYLKDGKLHRIAPETDPYKIIHIDSSSMEYKYAGDNEYLLQKDLTFKVKKVSDDFQLK